MPHSKFRKRGQSLYLDNWNPSAKKYINICSLCGRRGYSPAIEEVDFVTNMERQAIYNELKKMFHSELTLDAFGRCDDCARRQDK